MPLSSAEKDALTAASASCTSAASTLRSGLAAIIADLRESGVRLSAAQLSLLGAVEGQSLVVRSRSLAVEDLVAALEADA